MNQLKFFKVRKCFLIQKPQSKYLAMFMANILIFSDYSTSQGTLTETKSSYSLEITWIEGSKVQRRLASFSPTKSNFLIISTCLGATTSASQSIGCMGFMMNAKGGIISKSGRTLVSASMSCLFPLLLMIEFCACMEVLAQI